MDTEIIEFRKLNDRIAENSRLTDFCNDVAVAAETASALFAEKFGCNVIIGKLTDLGGHRPHGHMSIGFEATCCGVPFDVGFHQELDNADLQIWVVERLESRCGSQVETPEELHAAIVAANPGLVEAATKVAHKSFEQQLEEAYNWPR